MNKLIFFFLIILLFLSKTQNIFAYQETFTVDNIIIEGNINQSNYKNKYINIGFRKSFQKLVANILKSEDQKKILSTDIQTIKSLTENYRILEEQISEDAYSIKIEIKFDRSLVNKFLFEKNIPYSEVTKLRLMVYPILVVNSELQLFSENKFFTEWNDNKNLENIEFILPIENVDDIDFIKKNLSSLEENNLIKLVENYEVKNSSIVILRHEGKKLNAFLKTNFKGIKRSKKLEFNLDNLNDKKTRAQILDSLKLNIYDFWKEENLIDISVPSYLTVITKIKNSGSLSDVINKFEKITLIEKYTIEEIDNKSVKIKIKYLGKIKNLQESFIDYGFNLKISNDQWSLTLDG